VTRFSLWLVAITASFGLAAGQAAQEKPKLDFSPCEVQLGVSMVAYDSQRAVGSSFASADFKPKGLGMSPSLKVSVDIVPFKIGNYDASVLLSGSWRFSNDVPLEFGSRDVPSDLQHKSQMSLGAVVKVDLSKNFDVGLGLDERQDWMFAKGRGGRTDSEDNVWRPWLRAQSRYLFDKGTSITPFVGVEASFALAAAKVNSMNYYRDIVMNTGYEVLGQLDPPDRRSPESFTKGHVPLWEVAIVGGVRFGRHCR